MSLNERQRRIVDTLVIKENTTVEELSSLLKVSSVTIRNDLAQLSKQGKVVRTHGGAQIAVERIRQEQTFASHLRVNAAAKIAIGERAAKIVNPNDSILLDASSTSVAVAQAIRRLGISFGINAFAAGIWTALELLGDPNIHVFTPGGNVRNTTGSFTGNITKKILNEFNFNKVFLGAWGADINGGFTDSHMLEAELKRDIMARAQEVIMVIDSSKFGKVGLAHFASSNQIDKIFTDNSAPVEHIKQFKDKGVEVIIAN